MWAPEDNIEVAKLYSDVEPVLATIRSGEVRPLKGSYIVKMMPERRRLERRQDLPEEAFFDLDKDMNFGCLQLYVLSYRWITKDHPDPELFHVDAVGEFAAGKQTRTLSKISPPPTVQILRKS